MKIIVTKQEKQAFKETKDVILSCAQEVDARVSANNPWEDYRGIEVESNEEETTIEIQSELIVDVLITYQRVFTAVFSFIVSLKEAFEGLIKSVDIQESAFTAKWKKGGN